MFPDDSHSHSEASNSSSHHAKRSFVLCMSVVSFERSDKSKEVILILKKMGLMGK